MRALFLLMLLVLPVAAQAQAPGSAPMCIPEREGMVACFGEKLCECRFQPGGQLTARPSGHRWDCGALRPSCGVTPASPGAPAMPPINVTPILPSPMPPAGYDPRQDPRYDPRVDPRLDPRFDPRFDPRVDPRLLDPRFDPRLDPRYDSRLDQGQYDPLARRDPRSPNAYPNDPRGVTVQRNGAAIPYGTR